MAATRFYFADAAAQGYLDLKALEAMKSGDATPADLLLEINHGLQGIVTRFPATRGFGWQPHRNEQ